MNWFDVKKLWNTFLKSRKKMATSKSGRLKKFAYKMEPNTLLIKVVGPTGTPTSPALAFKLRYYETNLITWMRRGDIHYNLYQSSRSSLARVNKYGNYKFTFRDKRLYKGDIRQLSSTFTEKEFTLPYALYCGHANSAAKQYLTGDREEGLKAIRKIFKDNEYEESHEKLSEIINGPICGRQIMLVRYILWRGFEYQNNRKIMKRQQTVLAV